MTTKKSYMYWNRFCKRNKNEVRLLEEELIVRKEDSTHTDYVCPDCEKVIICKQKVRSKNVKRI